MILPLYLPLLCIPALAIEGHIVDVPHFRLRAQAVQYRCPTPGTVERRSLRHTKKVSELMSDSFALLSIVFMISFVLLFDRVHISGCYTRFCKNALLNQQEIDRLQSIISACQEG